MEARMKPQLGDLAHDVITNFRGIVVSHTRWLTGCDVYGLAPTSRGDDGKPLDSQHFDEARVEVLEAGKVQIGNAGLVETRRDAPGGPSSLDSHPSKRS